jgi:hypothetical protein
MNSKVLLLVCMSFFGCVNASYRNEQSLSPVSIIKQHSSKKENRKNEGTKRNERGYVVHVNTALKTEPKAKKKA